MTQEDFFNILISIDGIGNSKAKALVDRGYDTIEKIQSATIEELTKVKGISDTIAKSLKNQLTNIPLDITKKEITIQKDKDTTKKTKTTTSMKTPIKEIESKEDHVAEHENVGTTKKTAYEVKKKPKLSNDIKQHLKLRNKIKKHTPEFLREEWFRYKRIPRNWRRPDGITSKMRRHYKYRPNVVSIGYRGPKSVRGLHASGFEEVLIYNVTDLNKLDSERQAARIGSSVGTKKRLAIEKKARELDIRLLNK
jgi:large subunit ribosomal protein L32e